MKWYMMAEQSGFAREARSMGVRSLNPYERISFFRGELVYGVLFIPLVLILNRYLPARWSAILTGAFSLVLSLLLGIQIISLREFGRFSSLKMVLVGLSWGWHEPGSNIQFLMSREAMATLVSVIGIGVALAWAVRNAGRATSMRAASIWTTAGRVYLLAVVAVLLFSIKSDAPKSAYHENSFVRAVSSLWKENAVENYEFNRLNTKYSGGIAGSDLSYLSDADLIAQYRQLTHAPAPERDLRYFGKEAGANVLFFVLETTPQKYLPVGEDLKQFPNFNGLQENSFLGARHYTTFPMTRSALFSVLSSWYPINDFGNAFDSPAWESTDDFLRRLNDSGYKTAVFSPLRAPGIPDTTLFDAVGFSRQVYPESALTAFSKGPGWQEARIAADVDTLHLLESQLDQWMKQGHRFAVAFLPQIAHVPYPDGQSGSSAKELQLRAQALLQKQDAWLGELLDLLRKRGQLDNTIIVVLGDHGLRAFSENPDMRRGTIDETAFHVPLLVHAPRALNHTEKIPWLTSHIDLVPTLLDLLGAKNGRESEQGTAIWNPALADRDTFFFAKGMFGADGYTSQGQFFMWHYFSDSVYKKASAEFDSSDIVPRRSSTAKAVMSKISTMVALEVAWHRRFAGRSSSRKKSLAVAADAR
jgi:phosphoglycerol transferase MdoB-like AlkP superfamily enzyme